MSKQLTKSDLKILTKIPLNVRRQICHILNVDNFEELMLSAFNEIESYSVQHKTSAMKFLNQKGGAIPAKYQFFVISLMLVAGVMLTLYYYNISYSPQLLKKIEHAKVLVEETAGIIFEQAKISNGYGRLADLQKAPYIATDTTLKSQMQTINSVKPISVADYKAGVRNQTLIADKITSDVGILI